MTKKIWESRWIYLYGPVLNHDITLTREQFDNRRTTRTLFFCGFFIVDFRTPTAGLG